MSRNQEETLYWHDYETFGVNPQIDGVAQFAGIRTDKDLNIIGEKLDILCQPTPDRLPHPEACMVTGISPLNNIAKGLNEVSFFHQVEKELAKAGTCGIGYNNISFDDEVTRNGFYRNFISPYDREWKNNCSRWDLLNVVRLAVALHGEIINVPVDPETGNKIFKLDQLSPANGIEHENAHDALSDVIATIELAKKIKEAQPEFWEQMYTQRNKQGVANFFFPSFNARDREHQLKSEAFISAESYFGGVQDFVEALYPVYATGNNVYCIKLTKDISKILELDAETLKTELYKKKEEMQEGEQRIPLHTIQINKCPVIFKTKDVTPEIGARLKGKIDSAKMKENMGIIKANHILLQQKLKDVFGGSSNFGEADQDPDTQIYTGGFFDNVDSAHFAQIKKTSSADLLDYLRNTMKKKGFKDKKRVPEMVFRYICRNYEQDLDQKALDKWFEFCKDRIEQGVYSPTFEQYQTSIDEMKEIHKDNPDKINVLNDLEKYAETLKIKLKI